MDASLLNASFWTCEKLAPISFVPSSYLRLMCISYTHSDLILVSLFYLLDVQYFWTAFYVVCTLYCFVHEFLKDILLTLFLLQCKHFIFSLTAVTWSVLCVFLEYNNFIYTVLCEFLFNKKFANTKRICHLLQEAFNVALFPMALSHVKWIFNYRLLHAHRIVEC